MPDNINNDYNELAKLIYPSIEASGNVYYGQTRKLAIDELFNINDGGFESSVKTIRRQTDSNEDGFEYISYFCWKFGPLNGRIRIVPCGNNNFIFTFANFQELEKIYHLDDTYITNDSADPIVGTLFIRYKLLLNDNTVEHILNSGTFNSYEKIISLDTNDIRVYITDNCDPTDVDNRDIDDRNIFVKHENDAYYLFVKLCKCADFESDALYFTNINDGESTVKLIVNGELQTDYEYYKSHITGWQKYNIGDVITLANRNDKVYFRGTRSQQDYDNYIQFNLTGKLSVGGNINSLLSHDESIYKNITDYTTFETANENTFKMLFENQSSLHDASLLKLNTHNLATFCCHNMFKGCTNLTQAPELSATTLNDYCYISMFEDCTSLNQAPELPAITLANTCYYAMFKNCTSLIKAPDLPATTLSEYCYDSMFYCCTSLTQAPELPATTLTDGCYYNMFMGCTSLNHIKCLATDTSATGCTDDWLANVAAIGTFECDNKKYFTLDSSSGIPKGWTIIEINPEIEKPDLDIFNPEIPFCIENIGDASVDVGLYNSGKNAARSNCQISYDLKTWSNYTLVLTNDSTSAIIDKITLHNRGDRVYIKADKINKGTVYPVPHTRIVVLNQSNNTKIRARGNIASLNYGSNNLYKTNYLKLPSDDQYYYTHMLQDCTSLIQAPELPATTLNDSCYSYMFSGCTNLTQAPELPAARLQVGSYSYMFSGCTNLTQAPELPATALNEICYCSMFENCTSLTQAPELPVTILSDGCYMSMFFGCKSLTEAPELPATELVGRCYREMFYGCSSLNSIRCLATDALASICTERWLTGVSSTGDFYTPSATIWETNSTSGIPTGWTRHDI